MLNNILKQLIVVSAISVFVVYAVQNRISVQQSSEKSQPATAEVRPKAVSYERASSNVQMTTSTGGKVSIPKSTRDGQFWTDAKVNNRSVKFLVDTGASSVALTPKDAKAAGVNPRRLDYNVRIQTANGIGRAASVTLKSIKIGNIKVRNVRAIVVEEGLSVSLLGMSYLGQIKDIQVKPDVMILDN